MELPYGLTPKQAATVAFISAFVTVIGGLLLALWFRRTNRKGNENA
jgi:ABC-type spermidine/putrescine transport system permease subunit II